MLNDELNLRCALTKTCQRVYKAAKEFTMQTNNSFQSLYLFLLVLFFYYLCFIYKSVASEGSKISYTSYYTVRD